MQLGRKLGDDDDEDVALAKVDDGAVLEEDGAREASDVVEDAVKREEHQDEAGGDSLVRVGRRSRAE